MSGAESGLSWPAGTRTPLDCSSDWTAVSDTPCSVAFAVSTSMVMRGSRMPVRLTSPTPSRPASSGWTLSRRTAASWSGGRFEEAASCSTGMLSVPIVPTFGVTSAGSVAPWIARSTCVVAVSVSVPYSRFNVTTELPPVLLDVVPVTPVTPATAASIGSVTCSVTTSGDAPA